MDWKRLLLAAVAVFVAQAVVAGILQVAFVDALYDLPEFFRPEGNEKILIYSVSRILFVSLFSYIYAKGYEGGGVGEGVRFGILIWLFYSIPMTIGFWAFIVMPDGLALAWIGVGLCEYLVGGLVLGLIYRSKRTEPAPETA
jgi:hypothetical protein